MLIHIEDYLNRRRQFQAQAQPLLVAVGGTMAPVHTEAGPVRRSAHIHVLPLTAVCCDAGLTACCDPSLPSEVELGGVYAEATLV